MKDDRKKISISQKKDRDFLISVFRKQTPATKKTLNKMVIILSNPNNDYYRGDRDSSYAIFGQRFTSKLASYYDHDAITSFFRTYNFKSINEYNEILETLKNNLYFETGMSIYHNFLDVITKTAFKSNSVNTDWIIDDMIDTDKFINVDTVINNIFTKEKGNEIEFLNKITGSTKGNSNSNKIYESIITNGMIRKVKGLDIIFNQIFSLQPDIQLDRIIPRYRNNEIKDKDIKDVIGGYLYNVTKEEQYLPATAKDIFLF